MIRALLSLAGCASLVMGTCSHGTFLEKRDGATAFGYAYTNGPMKWHDLAPEYSLCKTGRYQSPINIDRSIAAASRLYLDETGSINGTFENLGTTLQVTPLTGKRQVTSGGTRYTLKQFHFHTPSEHWINGEHYPMEMHMVHQSSNKKLLVLGILFEISPSGNGASQAIRNLANLTSIVNARGKSVAIDSRDDIDLGPIINQIDKRELRTYSGSLTTPPCSEGVTWMIYAKPVNIDVFTFNAFKKVLKYNSRPPAGPPGSTNMLMMV